MNNKNYLSGKLILALLMIMPLVGCSSPVIVPVDQEVAEMVARENQRLPLEVSPGIELTRIEFDPDLGHVKFEYMIQDEQFEDYASLKPEANERAKSDPAIIRALESEIRVYHQYHQSREGFTGFQFETNL